MNSLSNPRCSPSSTSQDGSGRWLLYSIGNATSSVPPLTACKGGYSPTHVGPVRAYTCCSCLLTLHDCLR